MRLPTGAVRHSTPTVIFAIQIPPLRVTTTGQSFSQFASALLVSIRLPVLWTGAPPVPLGTIQPTVLRAALRVPRASTRTMGFLAALAWLGTSLHPGQVLVQAARRGNTARVELAQFPPALTARPESTKFTPPRASVSIVPRATTARPERQITLLLLAALASIRWQVLRAAITAPVGPTRLRRAQAFAALAVLVSTLAYPQAARGARRALLERTKSRRARPRVRPARLALTRLLPAPSRALTAPLGNTKQTRAQAAAIRVLLGPTLLPPQRRARRARLVI